MDAPGLQQKDGAQSSPTTRRPLPMLMLLLIHSYLPEKTLSAGPVM